MSTELTGLVDSVSCPLLLLLGWVMLVTIKCVGGQTIDSCWHCPPMSL